MSAGRRNVVIIGGGLGGLTLANLLKPSDAFHVRVFERDADAHARSQGYSITLKDPGGLVPLRRLDLYDEVREYSSIVETLTILTQRGRELLTLREDPASPQVKLGVPRKELRDTLLQGVKEDVVFGETCTGYGTQNGRIVVRFASGKEVVADLVVACDGVNSVIRKQMIGDARHYLGIASIQGKCRMAPSIPALDSGPIMALGSGSSLFMLKDGDGVGWSLTTRAPEKEFDGLCHAALKERAIAATRGWASAFERVVSESDPSDLLALGGFYDRNPLAKASTDGVVLLGDAAHPMSPFRGEGANTAMQDALVFADALAKSEANLEVALSSYEREMLNRSRKYVLLSRNAAREMHSTNWWTQRIRNAKFRIANFFLKRHQRPKG